MPADKAARIILEGALAGKARVLVGADAHVMHHLAKLTGSRYQDVVARLAPRVTGPRQGPCRNGHMIHAPGTRVRCEMTKWGGRPHWEYDAVVLGEDLHGTWLGFPAGTTYTRPGHVVRRPSATTSGSCRRRCLAPGGVPARPATGGRRSAARGSRCTST